MLAADSRPENLRSATAGRSIHQAPAAVPDLCARFRPPRLASGQPLFPSASLWCAGRRLSAAGSGCLAAAGSGHGSVRRVLRSVLVGGAVLGPPGLRCRPPGGRLRAGDRPEFSVLILRGFQPLSAARSVSSGENTRCCSSVGPHRVAFR